MNISPVTLQYKSNFNIYKRNEKTQKKDSSESTNFNTHFNISFRSAMPVDDKYFFDIDDEIDFNFNL